MNRAVGRGAALAASALLLTGCGFQGAYSFTLPGGADIGDDPYRVRIEFLDVLDLVPQSGVRVADVPVGRVEEIELGEDWTAVVTVVVNGDVELPANAVAAIGQSSLLGEKFVELAAPGAEQAAGHLAEGAVIPLARTNRNVEVEELLGALSLVLNGGGLAQLQTINRELGEALDGRAEAIRATLSELDTFVGGLDEQREEINRALDSIDALAGTLASRTATIETALDTIGPGLDVLTEQRGLLVSMLESLGRLGEVGTRVINQAGADTVEDLRLLQPILTQLAAAGPDLAGSLDLLLTYPFPASSLTALHYRSAQTGGYGLFANMTATLNFDLTQLLCRYVVDPVTGALKILDPQDLAGQECGRPGSQIAVGGADAAGGAAPPPAGPLGLPTLPGDVLGRIPAPDLPSGPVGLPQLPGVGR